MRLLIGVLAALAAIQCQDIYEAMKTDVVTLTNNNWNNQVAKGRQNEGIFIIHFYTPNDGKSYDFSKQFKEKSTEFKGIITFGYVNCQREAALCKREVSNPLPVLKVYPPVPVPAVEMDLILPKALGMATQHIKGYTSDVDDDNLPGFVTSDPSLPKVLLFTDKTGSPMIFRALSTAFNKKLKFGIVRESSSDVVSTYQIRKFPTVIVIKSGSKKPFVFDKEINYRNLFDFLNVFSEQFATSEGSNSQDTKPWLFEAVPELTDKSAKEVCLNLDKTLCVILFTQGKPETAVFDTLKELRKDFDNKLDRSISFKFVWIDSSKHTHWNKEFGVEGEGLAVRVLNPGRRKRFVKMEEPFGYKAVERTLEKIIGGDARFVNIRTELPAFAVDL